MAERNRPARLPPRWFIVTFWKVHRGLNRMTGGRRFLWGTGGKRGWGALSLTTIGRRTGQERVVILGYLEDGPDLVVMAMNGWGPGEPAWWLNLQAHPHVTARLSGGRELQVGRPRRRGSRARPSVGAVASGRPGARRVRRAARDADIRRRPLPGGRRLTLRPAGGSRLRRGG